MRDDACLLQDCGWKTCSLLVAQPNWHQNSVTLPTKDTLPYTVSMLCLSKHPGLAQLICTTCLGSSAVYHIALFSIVALAPVLSASLHQLSIDSNAVNEAKQFSMSCCLGATACTVLLVMRVWSTLHSQRFEAGLKEFWRFFESKTVQAPCSSSESALAALQQSENLANGPVLCPS